MKPLAILAAIVIVGGGVWWFIARNGSDTESKSVDESELPATAKTEPGVTEAQTVIITYTDSGFSQSEVAINPGDSVVFKNESSRSFWPASDPHPVHTELSEFDSRTAVPSGQSYTMTFAQSGRWGFHNHLNSSETGTVIVR